MKQARAHTSGHKCQVCESTSHGNGFSLILIIFLVFFCEFDWTSEDMYFERMAMVYTACSVLFHAKKITGWAAWVYYWVFLFVYLNRMVPAWPDTFHLWFWTLEWKPHWMPNWIHSREIEEDTFIADVRWELPFRRYLPIAIPLLRWRPTLPVTVDLSTQILRGWLEKFSCLSFPKVGSILALWFV